MRLFLGHILVAMAGVAAGISIVCAVYYGISIEAGEPRFELVFWTFLLMAVGLILGGIGSSIWKPKWYRDERRESLLERSDKGTRPGTPVYPYQGLDEAHSANEKGEKE